jgi:hypothetical protein
MSSCTGSDYKDYVPADSKVVAKIDFKEFIAQTGVDQEKLFKDIVEQYGDDVADFKNSGLDLTMPFYIFARNSGSEIVYGVVAKVTDRVAAEKFYAKSSKNELKPGKEYSFFIEDDNSVAVTDDAMVFVGKSNKDKDSMERTLTRIMSKDMEGSLADNKIFAQADGSTSFASLCADMSIIPDEALEGANSMAGMSSKDLEELRSVVVNLEGTATDGVCDFICSAKSDNKEMQERIDKSRKAFGKISEKAFSSFSSGDMFGFAMNTDGAQLAELIKDAINRSSNEDMKNMMGQMIEQVSKILSKIRGNVVGVMNSPQDFIIKAEGKNIANDIVDMMNESGMGGAFGLKSTSNGYSIGNQAWFGYEDGNFYITGNENTAAQPSKVMGGPAPSQLTNLMKDRKAVIYGNVSMLKDMAAASGGTSSRDLKAFDAIYDKVKYVTLSYK